MTRPRYLQVLRSGQSKAVVCLELPENLILLSSGYRDWMQRSSAQVQPAKPAERRHAN